MHVWRGCHSVMCVCAGTAEERGMHVWRECHSVMYVCGHGWGARHARVAWVSLSCVCVQARLRSAACTCGMGVTQLCMCAGTAEERGMYVWHGCHSVMYVCRHGWGARHALVAWRLCAALPSRKMTRAVMTCRLEWRSFADWMWPDSFPFSPTFTGCSCRNETTHGDNSNVVTENQSAAV